MDDDEWEAIQGGRRPNPFTGLISDVPPSAPPPPRDYGLPPPTWQDRQESLADAYTRPEQRSGIGLTRPGLPGVPNGTPGPPPQMYQGYRPPGQPQSVGEPERHEVAMGTPVSPEAAAHWKQQVQDYAAAQQARQQRAIANPNPWTKQQVGNLEAALDRIQMRDNATPLQKQQASAGINRKLDILDPHRVYRRDSLGNQMTPVDKFAANNVKIFPEHGIALALDQRGVPHWHTLPQKKDGQNDPNLPDHVKPWTAADYAKNVHEYLKSRPDASIDEAIAATNVLRDAAHSHLPPGLQQHGGQPATTAGFPTPTAKSQQAQDKAKQVQEKLFHDQFKEALNRQHLIHKESQAGKVTPEPFEPDFNLAEKEAKERIARGKAFVNPGSWDLNRMSKEDQQAMREGLRKLDAPPPNPAHQALAADAAKEALRAATERAKPPERASTPLGSPESNDPNEPTRSDRPPAWYEF